MNNKILLTLLILLTAVFAVGAISASEVNVTDSYATNLVDDTSDVSVPLENTADSSDLSVSSDSNVDNDSSKVSLSSEEVLESDNSNILSTNSDDNDLLSSDSGVAEVSSDAGNESNVSSTIDVSKTITAKDITKYYQGSTQYSATFLDAYGNPLADTDVQITVNGVLHTVKTNANGVASLAINLKPGTYKVVAVNPATGYNLTRNFKILSTITANDISKVYTDGRKFSAKFYNGEGKVLAKKTVKFKINGKTYKVKTNSKGVATLSLKTLKKGTYKIISYNTDGLTKTNKVKVLKSVKTKLTTTMYTFLKKDTKRIKVKLLNSLGYAPGKGKIIKFKVNGKTYSRKTNSKGVATLKLPSLKAGAYTVKYSFAGSKLYKKSSASNKLFVITTKNPTFTVKSTTIFNYGSNTQFKVALTAGKVPLAKRTVTFTLDGKSYTKTTNSKGIASLTIKLPVGKYVITYKNKAESKVKSKTVSKTITVKMRSNGYGYWVFGDDMKKVNLKTLASQGTTDLFLNFYALTKHGQSAVESWIASANKLGMKVHIWMQAFYEGSWINPVKNGVPNQAFFDKKIAEAKKYAKVKGVAGVHIDYLRYPGNAYQTSGGTAAINSFVKQITQAIHSVNSNLIVSCAVMPEKSDNKYYYGQDMATISQYMDVVIPMIYKGNYNSGTSWIKSTTKWFVDNSKGAKIWSGLQGYVSDENTAKLSSSAIKTDSQAAINGGASGVIIFRWGVTNFVNFNSLT